MLPQNQSLNIIQSISLPNNLFHWNLFRYFTSIYIDVFQKNSHILPVRLCTHSFPSSVYALAIWSHYFIRLQEIYLFT
jgi:hypothetical protein